jgi:hypothetical protein
VLDQRPEHPDLHRPEVAAAAEHERDRRGPATHPFEQAWHRQASVPMYRAWSWASCSSWGVEVGIGIGVLADLPDRLESYQVENTIIALLVACGIAMVLILRTIQKATTRLALLGILFLVGIGLWWQREELQDCKGQCTCHVFGQDVNMPDPINFNCPRD